MSLVEHFITVSQQAKRTKSKARWNSESGCSQHKEVVVFYYSINRHDIAVLFPKLLLTSYLRSLNGLLLHVIMKFCCKTANFA